MLSEATQLIPSEHHISVKFKEAFKFYNDRLKDQSVEQTLSQLLQQSFGRSLKIIPYTPLPSDGERPPSPVNAEPERHIPKRINDIVSMFEGTVL